MRDANLKKFFAQMKQFARFAAVQILRGYLSSLARRRAFRCAGVGLISFSGFAVGSASYIDEFKELVEKSDYFNQSEKEFAKQLFKGTDSDDSVLDAIMKSPVISQKQKEIARQYFQQREKPKSVRYKDPRWDPKLEVVSPSLRFHGDLDFQVRHIGTARDIASWFSVDNADYDEGLVEIFKGRIRYSPEGKSQSRAFGWLDFDIQSRDGEQEIVNSHFQNGDNFLQMGTFLSPDFSEFGLRNTEFMGFYGHLYHQKWELDLFRGETVEDYVVTLDGISVGGMNLKRHFTNQKTDWFGVSYYDAGNNLYLGFNTQGLFLNDRLRLYGEFMQKDSKIIGWDGSAQELEIDYEASKVVFRNEIQLVEDTFSSLINPEYAVFGNTRNEYTSMENAFTYRFDPFVTSSVVSMARKLRPFGGVADLDIRDFSWSLMTSKPGRPRYMFLLKNLEKTDHSALSVDEAELMAMATTTFRHRDLVTSVSAQARSFDDSISPAKSYQLSSIQVDFSRPFLSKVKISESLGILNQNYEDDSLSNESQTHRFEMEYQIDPRTKISGVQKYRRLARKSGYNKYKMIYQMEASRQVTENLAYKLRLDSYNNNEFTKGYDANLISMGVDMSF